MHCIMFACQATCRKKKPVSPCHSTSTMHLDTFATGVQTNGKAVTVHPELLAVQCAIDSLSHPACIKRVLCGLTEMQPTCSGSRPNLNVQAYPFVAMETLSSPPPINPVECGLHVCHEAYR
ncbi:hypothetical protein BKA56DRAFT_592534 [Ilyonectria sp. MPI-CAGE-AT-0026]|nr:hypothetical protein BKA56DRAFT_592534 [Ilyonectria sp. MPI-CAGE-AT-0026]